MDRASGRALQRALLRFFAGLVGSWAGIIMLLTLSIVWPRNYLSEILLALWVAFAVASVAALWRDRETAPGGGRIVMIVEAPLLPLLRAGTAIKAARNAKSPYC